MRIQDVEKETGLDRATIRFYEKEGLVVPVRHENGYREYDENDLQLLMKIKLLRQLDVSLVKIKQLQQGSADISTVLEDQINYLEQRMQRDDRAKSICIEMRRSGVAFCSLDSAYYLRMLQSENTVLVQQYQEPVELESHPVRRFFARLFDRLLITTIIEFIFVVVLRIRPFSNILVTLVQYLAIFIAVPIEAGMLSSWGTTPGKWLMGIRTEDVNGGKMDFLSALNRSFAVLKDGCGFYIPFWSIYRMYKSYNTASVGVENTWDEEVDVIYTPWKGIKVSVFAVLSCLIILINVWIATDTVMPRNKVDNLTMSDFIENYQNYERMFGYDDMYFLDEQGRWVEKDTNSEIVIIGYEMDRPRKSFEYEIIDGKVNAIHYSDEWTNFSFMDVLPSYCLTATYAVVGSRKAVNYNELKEIEQLLDQRLLKSLEATYKEGIHNMMSKDSLEIEDVRISWMIEIDGNAIPAQGMLLTPDSTDTENVYKLEYHIEIIQ